MANTEPAQLEANFLVVLLTELVAQGLAALSKSRPMGGSSRRLAKTEAVPSGTASILMGGGGSV